MKYQVGDDILVLHSNEEGKVIEVISDKMVMIEVRGVKFPAYMDQIDFPYFHRFTKKKVVEEKKPVKKYVDQVPKEKPTANKIKVEEGVWLSMLPKFGLDDFNDEVVELFKLYLVNKTDKAYGFVYKQQFFGQPDFELKNEVLAFHDFYLHDIPFENLNDNPSFSFEFTLTVPDKKKAEHFEATVKLKAKQVFQRIEEMKERNQPTISYELFKTFPDKAFDDRPDVSPLVSKGYKVYEASKARQHLEPARSVVDLHIEKLMSDFKHLDNFEILNIQLKEFEKWYELALAHYQASLTVIHGVGSGRLRDEIHSLLKVRKEVKTFINQYDPRFGYGATEIFFQY
ncbi:Smr/MutS family protein [Foetidibacter luteolus]|uniref:Smr/MutS family protein n=1 Tax=Foetidibacter luteolus TaxID=2608880 RepID=UPI00129AD3EE|nr:Smr/MutS family protein [Foetidibacter luteolus]